MSEERCSACGKYRFDCKHAWTDDDGHAWYCDECLDKDGGAVLRTDAAKRVLDFLGWIKVRSTDKDIPARKRKLLRDALKYPRELALLVSKDQERGVVAWRRLSFCQCMTVVAHFNNGSTISPSIFDSQGHGTWCTFQRFIYKVDDILIAMDK